MPETIAKPLTSNTAAECVCEALETMAFIVPEPAEESPAALTPCATITRITFRTQIGNGVMELIWPAAFGAAMEEAVCFDPSEGGESNAGVEALNEVANVSCGLLLRNCGAVAGASEVGLPLSSTPAPGEAVPPGTVWLNADGHLVGVNVAVQG